MSVGTESHSSSRDLSSSISSLNQSTKRLSSEVSKVYKHASQLFLTRRLFESYEALQPVIIPPDHPGQDDSPALAPIATATTSQRIKIWSLYVTLLNSIVDLGDAEGRRLFGSKEYRDIVRRVQNGDIWEQVVRDGYRSREGSVDAEVVYNLYSHLPPLHFTSILTFLQIQPPPRPSPQPTPQPIPPRKLLLLLLEPHSGSLLPLVRPLRAPRPRPLQRPQTLRGPQRHQHAQGPHLAHQSARDLHPSRLAEEQ